MFDYIKKGLAHPGTGRKIACRFFAGSGHSRKWKDTHGLSETALVEAPDYQNKEEAINFINNPRAYQGVLT